MAVSGFTYPCLKYETEAKKLLADVENATTLAKIREIFKEFAEIYTVLPALWKIWIIKESESYFPDFDESKKDQKIKEVNDLAKTHFYYASFLNFDVESFMQGKFGRAASWYFLNQSFTFSLTSYEFIGLTSFSTPAIFQALMYPHNELKDVKALLDQFSPYPIPANILSVYKKNKALIKEVIPKNNRHSVNISGLLKFQDKNLISETLEGLLGIQTFQKLNWQDYLGHLRNIDDFEHLLNLYSRYCRLFIDEVKMRREYEAELEEQSKRQRNVSKWWIDLSQIERHFGENHESRRILLCSLNCQQLHFPLDRTLVVYSSWCTQHHDDTELRELLQNFDLQTIEITEKLNTVVNRPIEFCYKNEFNFTDQPKQLSLRITKYPASQSFNLRWPLILYIYKNSRNTILFKLIQTCKYFFFREKPLLCHNLRVMVTRITEPTYVSGSLYLTKENLDFHGLNGMTVTNSLTIDCSFPPTICSELLPKIKLNISYLMLYVQDLKMSEFEILSAQKLKTCILHSCEIQRDDGSLLDLADIIPLLPTVKRLDMCPRQAIETMDVSRKLSQLQRIVKFTWFKIWKVNEFFNCTHFSDFIKNNSTENAIVVTVFSSGFTQEQKNAFQNTFLAEGRDVYYFSFI